MATPKVYVKDETNIFIPPKIWGDQKQLRPIRKGTLEVEPTKRTTELASPKIDHRTFTNKPKVNHGVGTHHTITKIHPCTIEYEPSDRIIGLAKPKTKDLFIPNIEPEEIEMPFPLKPGALTACYSLRLQRLAQPKQHPYFTADVDLDDLGKVIPRAMNAKLTWRTHELSEPKRYVSYDEQFMNKAVPGCAPDPARTKKLSRPKQLHPEHVYDKTDDEIYSIPQNCLKGVANERTQELAIPIQNRLDVRRVRYNSQAFIIPLATLKARPSQRIKELAKPIRR